MIDIHVTSLELIIPNSPLLFLSLSLSQKLMSVPPTMGTVPIFVLTLQAALPAAVGLDSHWELVAEAAMV